MKAVIAGGGTGGHLYPGLALAQEFQKRNVEVLFVGSSAGPEAQMVPAHGYRFQGVPIMGRGRGFSLRNARALGRLIFATVRSIWILGRWEPDVVVGMGGYVSLPVALAATVHRIPFVIHEQNRELGLANRIASRAARAIAVSFPGTESTFGSRGRLTGTPVREEIVLVDRDHLRSEACDHFELDPTRKTVLVFGGSQGARNLNEAVVASLHRWSEREDLQILLLAGPDRLPEVEASLVEVTLPANGLLIKTLGYTDRMDLAYAVCELAITRAGASTIFELASTGTPAVLVPLAISLEDDQLKNAEAVAELGGALVIRDADARADLGTAIDSLIDSPDRLRVMRESIREIARPDAAAALANLAIECANKANPSKPTESPPDENTLFSQGWDPQHRTVHMIGIGGAGMSVLAEVLAQGGIKVTGSDMQQSPTIDRLAGIGMDISIGHSAEFLGEPDLVIYSAAISVENPELVVATGRSIPAISRAEALARVLIGRRVVGFSGTHGKTTSSAMAAQILVTAGWDPTYLIGGEPIGTGGGGRWGLGTIAIVEADEAYGSFLHLKPAIGVVLNIDSDHLDYYESYEAIEKAFAGFMRNTEEKILVCADDNNAMRVAETIGDFDTFGVTAESRVRADNVDLGAAGSSFDLMVDGVNQGRVNLKVAGAHRIQNAIAAAAACLAVGAPVQEVVSGLSEFVGVARRFQPRGQFDGVDVYDDYAHLPKEIEATISAARLGSWQRIFAVFQPHLYSRTKAFAKQFGESLATADVVVITDVYAAREPDDPKVTGKLIVDAACEASPGKRVVYMPTLGEAADFLIREGRRGDLVLSLGAGDVTRLADQLVEKAMGH